MKIPFMNFDLQHSGIEEEMQQAFQRVYKSNWFIMGRQLQLFEEAYAKFNEVAHAIGVSNGLDALFLSLKALEIGKDDEVIVPSNTFIATVLAVSYVGATPVFVEPEADTYNIDPAKIEAAITKKTKAIIPVHLYGQACKMDAIMLLAEQYGLYVIEDNAQAHGASYNGRLTGTWGLLNATSFYPGKNLGALGDAGGITTDDKELAEKVKVLRNYGSDVKYHHEVIGHNMRMDEMQASFLSVKLQYLTEWTRQRQQVAEAYSQQLQNIGDIVLPVTAPNATHSYHLYVVRTTKRDELHQFLTSHGVGTLVHYPIPPHLQKSYVHLNYEKGAFPIAEDIAATCLSLPIWPGMSSKEIDAVCELIRSFFSK